MDITKLQKTKTCVSCFKNLPTDLDYFGFLSKRDVDTSSQTTEARVHSSKDTDTIENN